MAKDVIMPALGMAQETGTLLQWLKKPGEVIVKGEPLMEIETDKATVEVEAPASGVLASITAHPGEVIPVGQRIAVILAPGEHEPAAANTETAAQPELDAELVIAPNAPTVTATPVAARMAAEHNLDLGQIKPGGGRVQKEDVVAYLEANAKTPEGKRALASPKARRLAQERGLDLKQIPGSGPQGAVLAADVLAFHPAEEQPATSPAPVSATENRETLKVGHVWRVMAERVMQSWATIPQFHLERSVNAAHLMAWREEVQARGFERITYTDQLVKLVAAALRHHPHLNASWQDGNILANPEINIGIAIAIEDGLVVPVIHHADQAGLNELATRRLDLVAKAKANKLSPQDLQDGTFTISNLGMYGVDAFTAIINPPQAAILAVSRIADQVVALNGSPSVQPMMTLSLTCDHRVVDGARGAQFLQTLADLIENPMRMLD